jgi:hypothetical protein
MTSEWPRREASAASSGNRYIDDRLPSLRTLFPARPMSGSKNTSDGSRTALQSSRKNATREARWSSSRPPDESRFVEDAVPLDRRDASFIGRDDLRETVKDMRVEVPVTRRVVQVAGVGSLAAIVCSRQHPAHNER